MHKLSISHVQPTVQAYTDHNKDIENGGGGLRPRSAFFVYWVWSVYGLYRGLYMAYGQLMYSQYMAYV